MIARRIAALLLVPSFACASFEPEIIEPRHPSLAVGELEATSFELQPSGTTGTTTTQPTGTTGSGTTGSGSTGSGTTGSGSTGSGSTSPGSTSPGSTSPGSSSTGTTGSSASASGPDAGAATAQMNGDEVTIDRVEGQPEPDKAQRARNGVFWTGVVLAAAGGAGLLGFGIAGRVTQGQINKGYENDDLTHSQEQNLRDRGDAMNVGAATTGAFAVLGVAMFSIALGVDYVRCGKLTTRKRKDCVPRTRK